MYSISAPNSSHETLKRTRTKKPDWYVEDKLVDDRLSYTGKFKVYAKVIKKDFIPKGTELVDSETWEFVEVTKSDQYFKKKYVVDMTPLFKLKLNPVKDKARLVPKTINARTWIKNHNLTIYLQVKINQSKPKKRKIKPKEHKRFYNQFSNNKSY